MVGYLNSIVRRGAMVVAAVAVAPIGAVHAANLEGVRVWAGPDYTRVVIDAAGPLHYKIRQKGGEVSIDLADSGFSRSFSDPAGQGLLRGMSHARIGKDLQLTARVHPDSRLKSFVLEPKSGNNYRLVLDLYPGSAAADRVVSAQATPTPKAAPAHSSRASTQQAAALLNGQRAVVVAIDAGHGGKDSGAHGPSGTQEKNVTLAVARDLAALINRQPGMKAVLTRDSDFYIPLKQRYKIARENNADLFVSIHADSFTSDDAKGSSVWVLSPRGKTSEAARWLADRENRADLIGGTTLDDKDDGLAKVLLDLQQGWAIQASDMIAGNVLQALGRLGPTHRGYVERANFVVLRSPDVPSILVET
ncbi:MAG TPA: N-acetylmuramoyl-L-alanine amidase, partial [Rhodanobacter sp.]|nr:N-acetylmuramoyl-L-alanine amidase [Rhodanobacter sp.]